MNKKDFLKFIKNKDSRCDYYEDGILKKTNMRPLYFGCSYTSYGGYLNIGISLLSLVSSYNGNRVEINRGGGWFVLLYKN